MKALIFRSAATLAVTTLSTLAFAQAELEVFQQRPAIQTRCIAGEGRSASGFDLFIGASTAKNRIVIEPIRNPPSSKLAIKFPFQHTVEQKDINIWITHEPESPENEDRYMTGLDFVDLGVNNNIHIAGWIENRSLVNLDAWQSIGNNTSDRVIRYKCELKPDRIPRHRI